MGSAAGSYVWLTFARLDTKHTSDSWTVTSLAPFWSSHDQDRSPSSGNKQCRFSLNDCEQRSWKYEGLIQKVFRKTFYYTIKKLYLLKQHASKICSYKQQPNIEINYTFVRNTCKCSTCSVQTTVLHFIINFPF